MPNSSLRALSRLAALTASLLCGACGERVEAPSLQIARPSAPARQGCDALPAHRPAALTLRAQRTVIPHGSDIRREAAMLVDDPALCTEGTPCRVVPTRTLDRIYALALRHAWSEHASSPTSRSPHFGSRYVHIEWSTGRCSLGESSREALDERGRAALSAVFDEVVRGFAEASAPPPR